MKVVLQDSALLVANATDVGRWGYVQIQDGTARAADGYMLVEHPVEATGMDGQSLLVPAWAIKAAHPKSTKSIGRRGKTTKVTSVTVELRETELLVMGKYTILCASTQDLSFPNVDYAKANLKGEIAGHDKFKVSMLKKLLSACDPSGFIIFRFRKEGVAVEFISGGTHGLVMPAFLDEKQYKWYELPPETETPLPSAEAMAKLYEEMAHERGDN